MCYIHYTKTILNYYVGLNSKTLSQDIFEGFNKGAIVKRMAKLQSSDKKNWQNAKEKR